MDVFVHRPVDGLYLKNLDEWVSGKADARRFVDCTAAISFCIERELQGVRLHVAFSDPKHDFEMDVFRAETRMLTNFNRELRQQQRDLLAKLDSITAEAKERKKLFPFKRTGIGESDADRAVAQSQDAEPSPQSTRENATVHLVMALNDGSLRHLENRDVERVPKVGESLETTGVIFQVLQVIDTPKHEVHDAVLIVKAVRT